MGLSKGPICLPSRLPMPPMQGRGCKGNGCRRGESRRQPLVLLGNYRTQKSSPGGVGGGMGPGGMAVRAIMNDITAPTTSLTTALGT